jgi:hypothetical protein
VVGALVTGRFVQPSWALVSAAPIQRWVDALPVDDPLPLARDELAKACGRILWASGLGRTRAVTDTRGEDRDPVDAGRCL